MHYIKLYSLKNNNFSIALQISRNDVNKPAIVKQWSKHRNVDALLPIMFYLAVKYGDFCVATNEQCPFTIDRQVI